MEIRTLRVGNVVEGNVIKVEENTIYIDVQYTTEGKIHLDNFAKPAPETFIGLVKIGDVVKARVQKITDDPAQILLSRLPLLADENFEKIELLQKSEEIITTKVSQIKDKGLILKYLDYEIFLPYSLLDFELVKDKEKLKGIKLEVQIIEATKKGRIPRIVASRKAIFERERQLQYERRLEDRQQELDQINTGDVLKGIVEKLETHAATIKFEYVVGLLRISQVSHYRIEKIEDVLSVGDEIDVKVIKKEGNRLDLSIKALQKTPYEAFYDAHKVGDHITGTVFQKLPFGIIVEVDKDVRGLLHKNEFSWNPNDNYDAYVKIGDEVTLSIVNMDPKKERIALSKKSLEDNPWKNVNVRRGQVVNAPVKEITKDGILVEVDGILGLIPVNELSNDKIGRIEDYFAVDDQVEAVITDVNKEQWILKLSIRRVLEKIEREQFEQYLEDDTKDEGVTIGDLFADDFKKKK